MMENNNQFPNLSATGIDLTLLRHNLRLTVTERWEQHQRALQMLEALREAFRLSSPGGDVPSLPGYTEAEPYSPQPIIVEPPS